MFAWSDELDGGTVAVVEVAGGDEVNVTGNPPLLALVEAADDEELDDIVSDGIVSDGQSPGKPPLAEAVTVPPPPPLALVDWAAAPPAKTRQAVKSNTNGVATRSADIQTKESP